MCERLPALNWSILKHHDPHSRPYPLARTSRQVPFSTSVELIRVCLVRTEVLCGDVTPSPSPQKHHFPLPPSLPAMVYGVLSLIIETWPVLAGLEAALVGNFAIHLESNQKATVPQLYSLYSHGPLQRAGLSLFLEGNELKGGRAQAVDLDPSIQPHCSPTSPPSISPDSNVLVRSCVRRCRDPTLQDLRQRHIPLPVFQPHSQSVAVFSNPLLHPFISLSTASSRSCTTRSIFTP